MTEWGGTGLISESQAESAASRQPERRVVRQEYKVGAHVLTPPRAPASGLNMHLSLKSPSPTGHIKGPVTFYARVKGFCLSCSDDKQIGGVIL